MNHLTLFALAAGMPHLMTLLAMLGFLAVGTIVSYVPSQAYPTLLSLEYPNIITTTLSTAGNLTYTVAQVLGGFILRDTNGGARTDTLPKAADLVAAIPGCHVNTSFTIRIRNTAAGANTLTVAAGTGGTTSGTMTIAQNNQKSFLFIFTNITPGSEAYTVYSQGTLVF